MEISETVVWIVGIALLYLIVNYYNQIKSVNELRADKEKLSKDMIKLMEEKDTEISRLNRSISNEAYAQFEKFKENELTEIQQNAYNAAFKNAELDLEKWKRQNEIHIRQEAINRSYGVSVGKIAEHVLPFYKDFPFNPKDIRFIGSPIDLIVFDGANEENEDISIHLLEIKTGSSNLSKKQKLIKQAVINKRVFWREIKLDTSGFQPLSFGGYTEPVEADFSLNEEEPTEEQLIQALKDAYRNSETKLQSETSQAKNEGLPVYENLYTLEEVHRHISNFSASVSIKISDLKVILEKHVYDVRTDMYVVNNEKEGKSTFFYPELIDFIHENFYDFFE